MPKYSRFTKEMFLPPLVSFIQWFHKAFESHMGARHSQRCRREGGNQCRVPDFTELAIHSSSIRIYDCK